NLVAGFQVLGTLMVVGIMMLPATAARFWVHSVGGQMVLAAILGALASWAGLVLSYHFDVAASPAIILLAGLVYFLSVAAGPRGGLWQAWRRQRRRVAWVATGLGTSLAPVLLLSGLAAAPMPVRAAAGPVPVVATFSILGDMV